MAIAAKVKELEADTVLVTKTGKQENCASLCTGNRLLPSALLQHMAGLLRLWLPVHYSPGYVPRTNAQSLKPICMKPGNDQLVWAASSETLISDSDKNLIKSYIGIMVDTLVEQVDCWANRRSPAFAFFSETDNISSAPTKNIAREKKNHLLLPRWGGKHQSGRDVAPPPWSGTRWSKSVAETVVKGGNRFSALAAKRQGAAALDVEAAEVPARRPASPNSTACWAAGWCRARWC